MNLLSRRPRLMALALAALITGGATSAGENTHPRGRQPSLSSIAATADLTVMTYNVKGLPWPIASGRPQALRAIGVELAKMRARGDQPQVVVLQEAFVDDAKAIGALAGYRYRATGTDGSDARPELAAGAVPRRWYLGETQGKQVDSGLVILSDHPIRTVRRASFPMDACAGFDCLAAKGVLVALIDLPGHGPVAVATTHFNSRGASAAPDADSDAAFDRQARYLASYLRRVVPRGMPLVLAGDFNMGDRPGRIRTLTGELGRLAGGRPLREALAECMVRDARKLGRNPDAQWIHQRARDMQYVFPGTRMGLETVGGAVLFGAAGAEEPLSDHLGLTIAYRLAPLPAARTGEPLA